MSKEDRLEKFAGTVFGSHRTFPWSWAKTADAVMSIRSGALVKQGQDAPAEDEMESPIPGPGVGTQETPTPQPDNEDIVRGLLQVHQDQQATVAAAEAESRGVRQQLDQSRQQLQQMYQQIQAQQGQMQQLQGQAQQAVQQAQQQVQAMQQSVAPQMQQAQQAVAMAQQSETQAKLDLARLQQVHEQVRQSVLAWKSDVMNAVAQDPITLAEAQKLMEQQQAMAQSQQMQAQQQAMAQQQAAPQQGAPQGAPPQAQGSPQGGHPQGGGGGGGNPIQALSRAVAGQGDRAGMRRAMAQQYFQQAAQQGAEQGQGGMAVPASSLAGQVVQASLERNADELRALQVHSVLEKRSQLSAA